jgi:hypothetical protein
MTKVVWTSLADAILQNRTLERLLCRDTACDARLFEEVLNHWCALPTIQPSPATHSHMKHAHTHTSEPVHRCRGHNDRDLRKHLLHVKVLHLGANNIAPTDRLQERIRNYPVTILFS